MRRRGRSASFPPPGHCDARAQRTHLAAPHRALRVRRAPRHVCADGAGKHTAGLRSLHVVPHAAPSCACGAAACARGGGRASLSESLSVRSMASACGAGRGGGGAARGGGAAGGAATCARCDTHSAGGSSLSLSLIASRVPVPSRGSGGASRSRRRGSAGCPASAAPPAHAVGSNARAPPCCVHVLTTLLRATPACCPRHSSCAICVARTSVARSPPLRFRMRLG